VSLSELHQAGALVVHSVGLGSVLQ